MFFHFYVFVWKKEWSDWRARPADVSMPIEIGLPTGRVPSLPLLVQDVLNLLDLSAADVVRCVDMAGDVHDFMDVVTDVNF